MIEIRFHGRGGQGTVVASKILADALTREGKYIQAFPEFGVERRGAPVAAYARISDTKIWPRHKIYEPDHIVILDPTLIGAVPLLDGLKPGGWILVNTTRKPSELNFPKEYKVATVDATHIALKYRLGSAASPIVNTAIVGAFARVIPVVKLETLLDAIEEGVPIKPKENRAAAEEAYNSVIMEG